MRFDRTSLFTSVFTVVLASTMSTASCSSDDNGSGFGAGSSSSGASNGAGASGDGGSLSVGAGGNGATGNTGSSSGGAGVGGGSSSGGAGGDVSSGGAGVGGSSSGGAGSSNGGAGVGGGISSGGAGVGGSAGCGSTQCTDCVDNDADGVIDAFDVECVGPLDNDEGSFATGIPGDNSDACKQDCFFDGDSGSGNDGCLWNLKCDPLNPGAPDCPYDATYNNCPGPQPQKCIDNCLGYTPNGCDCFGCCDVTLSTGQVVTIKLGAGCTEEFATDPTVCKPCTKDTSCSNTCELCEYCLGKTELPPECNPSGSGGAGGMGMGGAGGIGGSGGMGGSSPCDAGVQVCTQTMPCPAGFYCLTGCCVDIPE